MKSELTLLQTLTTPRIVPLVVNHPEIVHGINFIEFHFKYFTTFFTFLKKRYSEANNFEQMCLKRYISSVKDQEKIPSSSRGRNWSRICIVEYQNIRKSFAIAF